MMSPTPWRASDKAGGWRVIRTTDLGHATRVETLENDRVWRDRWAADYAAKQANGRMK